MASACAEGEYCSFLFGNPCDTEPDGCTLCSSLRRAESPNNDDPWILDYNANCPTACERGTLKEGRYGNNARNIPLCAGDCDNDGQCAEGLTCHQRGTETTPLPGCDGAPVGEVDYCVCDSSITTATTATRHSITATTVTSTTATAATDTLHQAIGRLPNVTEVEQLIEKQLSALSDRLTKVSTENAALKRELEELRAKSTLSDEIKAGLRALLETPAAPGDVECEQGIGGACLATLEADGAGMVLAANSGTFTFETEECSKTDFCTVITAVRAMLAAHQ